ncbi:type II secretion system F family protein [Clostridium botulinum]|uniref:Pilus assembly protein n=1 Tax=Clostridium botulinum C/D str. DC5 TaxID=1443128 RepID=A0A0A0INZ3_CLOBO|nr:type II secretion system F family protein [Clostridium botulinum]KGN01907.1 pilus assembly protein [Clostridium botulinum C/D str. DC5]KOC55646.1 pilus assembly protein [Clostridium botulinum]KOC57553.1 pilus assembly protein [Clostridium botulinum]MCD3232762.1 type II secretion system F family protein [Clostridium botulinum D/C]MCD3238624.1 type II secretion system F family protein [Clostridium botulinum D/C]
MGIYRFKAIDLKGNLIRGKKSALKEVEFITSMREEGLFILDYKLINNANILKLFKKVTSMDIGVLCKQLGELLNAGINIETALEVIENQKINYLIRDSLKIIRRDIEKGRTLFQSINKFSKIYPEFMRQMILIGEKSGNLDDIFIKLAKYYTDEHRMKKKIKNAIMYPLCVLIMTIIVTLFITFRIIPKFVTNFIKLNKSIPIGIQRILKFNKIIISYKFYVVVFIIGIIVYKLYKKGCFQILLEKIIFKSSLGLVYKEIYEINIIKSLSILLDSGIPIITSLDIIVNSINNKILKDRLLRVICEIKEGHSLGDALKKEKMFNDFFISMISVGEKIGKIEELINNAVKIKEEDIENLISRIVKSIEPITIIILGVIITFIMMNILMPMMSTMDSII